MSVIAKGRLGDQEIEADVVNPGGWWGRLWLIEVGCGYSSVYYGVEADHESDALDEFADSKHVHHIQAMPDTDREDLIYLGNEGKSCDLTNVILHGPVKGFTYFDADDVDCQDIPPELYEWREKRWSIIEDATDEILKDDFRTEQEARDYLDSHGLDWHDYTFEELGQGGQA